jgi:hypothetical protein
MFFEMALCIAQGPQVQTGQRGSMLTVDGNGREPCGFGKDAWPPATRQIDQALAFFNPTYPSTGSFGMGLGENANDTKLEAALI